MIHSIEIAFFCLSTFEARTRANQADITGLGTIDLWHEFQIWKYVFKASETRFSGREAAQLAIKSRWVFEPRAKYLYKTKDFFDRESLKYYLRIWTTKPPRRCGPEGNLVESIWQLYCLLKKKQMMLARAHNRDTVPLICSSMWDVICVPLSGGKYI